MGASTARRQGLPRLTITADAGSSDAAGQLVNRYYTETLPDYLLWSRRLNMHFGFWRPGMSMIDREAMLEQMNVEVVERLRLGRYQNPMVADMGCGVGTVARTVARRFPNSTPVGITLVRWQAANAASWAAREGERPPPLVVGDYTRAPVRSGSMHGAYAVESSCYAPGLSKGALLEEMGRVVMPGGRMVVADAMLRRRDPSSPLTRAAHRGLCDSWALETLGHIGSFVDAASNAGFVDIEVEDISLHVLPSSLHVPTVTSRFLAGVLAGGRAVSASRWRNALVGLPLAVLAADPTAAGYFMVSANRR